MTVNVYSNSPKTLQGMTNNVGLAFSVGDTTPRFTISIGDTKYHIQCNSCKSNDSF